MVSNTCASTSVAHAVAYKKASKKWQSRYAAASGLER